MDWAALIIGDWSWGFLIGELVRPMEEKDDVEANFNSTQRDTHKAR